MREFRTKIGENGRIIIPAICRKELNLEQGEELIIKITDDGLRLISVKQSLKNAQSKVQALTQGKSLIEKLKTLRQEESNNG